MLVTFPFLFPAGEDFDKGREPVGCVPVQQELTPSWGGSLTLMLKVFLWPLYCLPKSKLQQHSVFCQKDNYFKHLGARKEGQFWSPEPAQPQLATQMKGTHGETVDSLLSRPRMASWGVLTPLSNVLGL